MGSIGFFGFFFFSVLKLKNGIEGVGHHDTSFTKGN